MTRPPRQPRPHSNNRSPQRPFQVAQQCADRLQSRVHCSGHVREIRAPGAQTKRRFNSCTTACAASRV